MQYAIHENTKRNTWRLILSYTHIDHKRISDLHRQGKTSGEISSITGYSAKQLYNAVATMRKHGVKISLNRSESSVVKSIRSIEGAPLTDLAPRRRRGHLEPFAARLDPEILQEIRAAAIRIGISQAVLIERAIIKYLDLRGRE